MADPVTLCGRCGSAFVEAAREERGKAEMRRAALARRPRRALSPIERMIDEATGYNPAAPEGAKEGK